MTTRVTLTPDELAGGQALGAYVKAQDELDAACRHLERMEIERPDGIGKAEWRMHRALRRRNRTYAAYLAAADKWAKDGMPESAGESREETP